MTGFQIFLKLHVDMKRDATISERSNITYLNVFFSVILECKVVSNLLCTGTDFAYDVKTPSQKEATLDKLYKRLRVLHTLVSKINTLLQPKDQLFEDEVPIQNVTRTIPKYETYVNSPKVANLTRSVFARTYIRSSTRNFPLSKLTKHLRAKNCSQLNFSVELDKLFNLSSENGSEIGMIKNTALDRVRERSVLHKFSPIKNRSSMRKIVLDRQFAASDKAEMYVSSAVEMQSLMDENESLQLTGMLIFYFIKMNNKSGHPYKDQFMLVYVFG